MFTMGKECKFDVIQLIHGVEQRPCLWDKSLENYKDRVERRIAWEEIFATLDETYQSMTPEEKRRTGEHILNKWVNIRDTFVKSLKPKKGKPKKKYILYDHLKFLLKVRPEDEASLEFSTMEVDNDVPIAVSYLKLEADDTEHSYNHHNTRKRKKVNYDEDYVIPKSGKGYTDDNGIDFVEVEESNENDARVMNEDEAFFASLLPTVVKYNEDERLEFRIEVLGVMKKLKEKRNWAADAD